MIVKQNFKEQIKTNPLSPKPRSGCALSSFFEKTRAYSKHLALLTILPTLLSGCSTIQTAVSNQIEAVKTDIQTQHDETVRIKRVRTALLAGNIEEAKTHRDTLYTSHWKCIATIEIAAAEYSHTPQEALKTIDSATQELWNISDANSRAMALLALLKFELETQKDIPLAKETLKQTENTIEFIFDNDFLKRRRLIELHTLVQSNNHLLSR